jgi:uncharacterized protein YdaU (DUF1376 family)
MTSAPYMPLYVADFLADTAHLSRLESGVYMHLIMIYWQRGKPLPSDDAKLCRIAGVEMDEWVEIRNTIAEFFIDDGETWTHRRIETELARAVQKIERARDAGRASAERRSNGRSTDAERTSNYKIRLDKEEDYTPSECRPPVDAAPPRAEEPDDTVAAFEAYNEAAGSAGWPKAQTLNPKRRSALKARLKDAGGLGGWLFAMDRARGSPFLTGQNDKGWMPDLDFFLQASRFTKLMEGGYDQRGSAKPKPGRIPGPDSLTSAIDRVFGIGDGVPTRDVVPPGDDGGGPLLDFASAGRAYGFA